MIGGGAPLLFSIDGELKSEPTSNGIKSWKCAFNVEKNTGKGQDRNTVWEPHKVTIIVDEIENEVVFCRLEFQYDDAVAEYVSNFLIDIANQFPEPKIHPVSIQSAELMKDNNHIKSRTMYTLIREFDIPLPWDVIHAATIGEKGCLYGYANGFVDFTYEVEIPGRSVFSLTQQGLNNLGRLILRKISDHATTVTIETESLTNEKEKEQYDRRLQHINRVIVAYLNRLINEISIWRSNNSSPPPYVLQWAGISPDSQVMKLIQAKTREDLEQANPFLFFQRSKLIKLLRKENRSNQLGVTDLMRMKSNTVVR